MLAQGNMIETGIKDAVGLATDSKGNYCVAHDRKISLLKADGSKSSGIEFASPVKRVCWDGSAFQIVMDGRSYWLEADWLEGDKDPPHADFSQRSEEMVRVNAGWMSWRRRFYGYQFVFFGGNGEVLGRKWTFRPISKRKRAWLETHNATSDGLEISVCDGSRLAYVMSHKGLEKYKFPDTVSRLVQAKDKKLGVDYYKRQVYAYEQGGRLRYCTELHFTIDGIEGSERGWILARNGRDFAVLDDMGRTRGIGRSEEPIRSCQISRCGWMVSVLTASGRIYDLVLRAGTVTPGATLTDVTYLMKDGEDASLQMNALRVASDELGKRESELAAQQAKLEKEREALWKRREAFSGRQAVLAELERRTYESVTACQHREAKLRATREMVRKELSEARLPGVMAERIKRYYESSSQHAIWADRLGRKLRDKAANAAEAKSRAEALDQELKSTVDELAQHRARSLELQAQLEVRQQQLRATHQERDTSQRRISACEEEFRRLIAAVDGARPTEAKLRAEIVERREALRELAHARSELEGLLARLPRRQEELRSVTSRLEERRLALRDTETELVAAQQERKELEDKLHRIAEEAGEDRAASEALQADIQAAEMELGTTAEIRAELQETEARLTERLLPLRRVRNQLEVKRAAVAEATKEHDKHDEALRKLEATLHSLESRLAEVGEQRHGLEGKIDSTGKALQESEKAKGRLEKRLSDLTEERRKQQKQARELTKAKEDAESKRDELRRKAQGLELDVKTAKRERDKLDARQRQLSRKVEETRTEAERMEKEIATRATFQAELSVRREGLKEDYEVAQQIKKGLEKVARRERTSREIKVQAKNLYNLVREFERGG